MKSTITTLGLSAFLAIGCCAVQAQVVPAGSSDKNLQDTNIKGRSNELERVKRDAEKPDQRAQPQQMPNEKFAQIKEDFENVQRLQNEIITAYTMSKQINYAKISSDAGEINKSSVRLESNLFPVIDKKDKKKSKEKAVANSPIPQDIKGIIVELDNTLAGFVGNPMFTNPQVVNSTDNAKAHSDIEKIIRLSAALNQEADKATKH